MHLSIGIQEKILIYIEKLLIIEMIKLNEKFEIDWEELSIIDISFNK